MKNYYTLIFFCFLMFSLNGQTQPIERIDFEPDPIMMDAYDFATGRMNDVKWMIKGTWDRGPQVGFEYKLTKALSGNIETSVFGLGNIGFSNNVDLNTRAGLKYYIGHQDAIANGSQGNNLNGKYLEFGAALRLPTVLNQNVFLGFGMQSRFLKHGFVDTGVKLQYFGSDGSLGLTTGFNLGFVFSKDYELVEMEQNRCAIVRCYDENFFMFKVPLSRLVAFSVSKSALRLDVKPTVELEHRLTRVSLTVTHELRASYNLFNSSMDSIFSYNIQEASYRAGIRWYVGKKKRIIKGKTSNNISGFYLGPIAEIGVAGGKNNDYKISQAQFYSAGGKCGYQTRLLKNLYFNIDFGFMIRDYFNSDYLDILDFSKIKNNFLFIDTGVEVVEIIPIAGVVVGYAF